MQKYKLRSGRWRQPFLGYPWLITREVSTVSTVARVDEISAYATLPVLCSYFLLFTQNRMSSSLKGIQMAWENRLKGLKTMNLGEHLYFTSFICANTLVMTLASHV